MRIVITCPSARESRRWLDVLQEKLPGFGLQATLTALQSVEEADGEADYAIGWKPPLDFFARHPKLKAFFNMGAGLDHFFNNPEVTATIPAHLPIVRIEDAGMAQQMADFCKHQVFDWMYGFARYRQQQKDGVWKGWREGQTLERQNCTIGLLGLGVLGGAVAKAFAQEGFPVIGHSRTPCQIKGVRHEANLQAFMRASKVVVVLAPATPLTQNIINRESLAHLPKGAYLINLARGALVDDDALLDALNSEQLAGACLDVFKQEPLPVEHPYWQHPKVVVTPHASAPTLLHPSAEQILGKIKRLEQGLAITGLANRSNS